MDGDRERKTLKPKHPSTVTSLRRHKSQAREISLQPKGKGPQAAIKSAIARHRPISDTMWSEQSMDVIFDVEDIRG